MFNKHLFNPKSREVVAYPQLLKILLTMVIFIFYFLFFYALIMSFLNHDYASILICPVISLNLKKFKNFNFRLSVSEDSKEKKDK